MKTSKVWQLLQKNKIDKNQIPIADDSLLILSKLSRVFHKSIDDMKIFISFVYEHCLDDVFSNKKPVFKFARSLPSKTVKLYIQKEAIIPFTQQHFDDLLQFGMHPGVLNAIITNTQLYRRPKTAHTVAHLFNDLFRVYGLSKNITPEILSKLQKEYYVAQNGEIKPLLFYAFNRSNLSSLCVEQEAIPTLIQRLSRYIEIPQILMIQTQNSFNLPMASDDMIPVSTMVLQLGEKVALSYWLNEHALEVFKDEMLGERPLFQRAVDPCMRAHTYILKAGIEQFIKKHHHILALHGLSLSSENRDSEPKSIKLRLDQVLALLHKTNAYLPMIKKMAYRTTKNDTFLLDVGNGQKKQMPICVISKKDKSKPIIFIYEPALSYFAKKHEEALLQMEVSYHVLQNLFQKANIPYFENNRLIKLHDLYLNSLSPLTEDEFEDVLLSHTPDTMDMINSVGEVERRNPMVIVQTLKKRYIAFHSRCLPPLIETLGDKLGLSKTGVKRLNALVQEEKPLIHLHSYLEYLGIKRDRTKFINSVIKPNLGKTHQENPNTAPIVFFTTYMDKQEGSICTGLFIEAIPLFLKEFEQDLLQYKAYPEQLNPFKEMPHRISIQLPMSSVKKIEREKE